MSVEIINNKSNIQLNYFGATHIFQKEDLTLQKFDTYIVFKDSHQKQKVNYLDVTIPSTTSIDLLIDELISFIDSKDTTSESIDLGNYELSNTLDKIVLELQQIKYELQELNR